MTPRDTRKGLCYEPCKPPISDTMQNALIILARERLRERKENRLKKDNQEEDDMRPEYNFSELKGHVRGKYVARYREGTNLVLLDPDVAAAFPDAKAVNEALRLLLHAKQDPRI